MPTSVELVGPADMYVSYGQLMIYDASVRTPGLDWTDVHISQGFARREDCAAFVTLLEAGPAILRVFDRPYSPDPMHVRVIGVPMEVASGRLEVCGPEELPTPRHLAVQPGRHMVWAAQGLGSGGELTVDLYVERVEPKEGRSQIVVRDAAITASEVLLETAEVARF